MRTWRSVISRRVTGNVRERRQTRYAKPYTINSLAHDSYAAQALRLNPKNYKALFRKAKALKEQGYFEKAEKILDEIIKDGEEAGKCR